MDDSMGNKFIVAPESRIANRESKNKEKHQPLLSSTS